MEVRLVKHMGDLHGELNCWLGTHMQLGRTFFGTVLSGLCCRMDAIAVKGEAV